MAKMSISPNTNKFNLFLFVSTAVPSVPRRIPEASIHNLAFQLINLSY